jgi:hypothetical protein
MFDGKPHVRLGRRVESVARCYSLLTGAPETSLQRKNVSPKKENIRSRWDARLSLYIFCVGKHLLSIW